MGQKASTWAASIEKASYHPKTDLKIEKAKNGYYAKTDLDGYGAMRAKHGAIRSKAMDAELLGAVSECLKGDGKIDLQEMKTIILPKLLDGAHGPELTCNERWTLRYCLGEFNIDHDARRFIWEQIHKNEAKMTILDMDGKPVTGLAATRQILAGPSFTDLGGEPAVKKARTNEGGDDELIVVDGMELDKGMLLATRHAVKDEYPSPGVVDAYEAIQIFKEAADGGGFTVNERWTFRFILSAFMFTDAAHLFLVEALSKIDKI